MKKLLVFIFVLFLAGPACSQQIKEEADLPIDTAYLYQDLRILSADSMGGRQTGSDGIVKAREYLINRFEEIGLVAYVPGYQQSFQAYDRATGRSGVQDTLSGVNLLSFIQGYTDSVIVISAHYDHIGNKEGMIYNGADDNASGVAVLLAVAEYFTNNKPEHTMLFAAFDAEEKGLQGSRYFMNSLAVDPSRIVLNVNLDMVSQNTEGELYAAGTRYHNYLKVFLDSAAQTSEVKLKYGHDGRDGLQDWSRSSDHSPFYEAGIPFIYFGVEDHPYYHKPTDTYESVPLPFFARSADLILQSIRYLDHGLGGRRPE